MRGDRRERFLESCLGLGASITSRAHPQQRAVSQVLFQTALKLAANRGLVDSNEPEIAQWRRVFAEQIRTTLRHIDAVDALAASRRAGLID